MSTDPAGGGSLTITELHEEYSDQLHRYAMGLTRDSNSANDLIQKTFIRAMTHLELLKQLKHYQRRAWLYRVLKNRFIDQQRAHQREQHHFRHHPQLGQLARIDCARPTVAQHIVGRPERTEALAALDAADAALDEEEREEMVRSSWAAGGRGRVGS